jgi:small subunit ribosomal protein S16
MVKIRLRRVGAKKQPHYRIVVADSRSPRDGRFIETIGHYNPRTEPATVEVDQARALYWLSVGAQPSEAVKRMLDKLQVMARAEAIRRGEVTLEELLPELMAVEEEEAEEAEAEEAKAEGAEEAEEDSVDDDAEEDSVDDDAEEDSVGDDAEETSEEDDKETEAEEEAEEPSVDEEESSDEEEVEEASDDE